MFSAERFSRRDELAGERKHLASSAGMQEIG
jgi:hypothetical protein